MVVASVPAQILADRVLPGLGKLLIVLVAIGGLAFNIGNVAGAGLGLDALLGLDPRLGAALSAVIAIGIFLVKEAGRAMDRFAQLMGGVMVVLAVYVAVAAAPPLGEALIRTVAPTGSTHCPSSPSWAAPWADTSPSPERTGCSTRESWARGHRLGDPLRHSGHRGRQPHAGGAVPRGARRGEPGLRLDPANPPASVFQHAAGALGYRLFGAVMWAAAITSVVGSAYTSVSFVRTLLPAARRADPRSTSAMIVGFIVISTAIFLAIGRPVTVLIAVGALNAFVLPIGLGAMLLASRRADLMQGYRHPPLLAAAGARWPC